MIRKVSLKTVLRKIYKRFFERIIGKIFCESQTDILTKPFIFKRIIRTINQKLNEKGYSVPWIYTKEECSEFWKEMDNASTSKGNRPENYAKKPREIIDFLHIFWAPQVDKNDSILEIGCNCGANLSWLSKLGYENLSGIEISTEAIEQMKSSFPELNAKIYSGDIASLLPTLPSKSFDMIFTMAVAMHIHPKNNFLFSEIARVSKKYICTIEPEVANSNYVFARNYRKLFHKIGIEQIKSVLITKEAFPDIAGYAGCVARIYRTEKFMPHKGV